MRAGQTGACLLFGALIAGPALAEPVAAHCKVERTIDLGADPQTSDRRTDAQRSNPSNDWTFVYDDATGRLCQAGLELCAKRATDAAATGGEVRATPQIEGADKKGVLILRPDGSWAYQQDLVQTLGGKGDCTFKPPTDHQVALLTLNPAKDRDVLCAARLAVEAEILNAQGQTQAAQSAMAWANALLERTNNRGYERSERTAAVTGERSSYAARESAARAADFATCNARIAEIGR